MADLPIITTLPPAPTPTDTPTVFASKAAVFVPEMTVFGDDINSFGSALEEYALLQIEKLTATLSATNSGLYDAVVIGDTDGVNTEFEVLGIGFYPAWNIFVDGLKISKDDMTISGSTVTLATAPVSGVSIEATGPRNYRSIAPDGYKAVTIVSTLNGTIDISCSTTTDDPIWRVSGQADTASENFTYENDGTAVSIYCFVPDDSVAGALILDSSGVIYIAVDYGMSAITDIGLFDNTELSSIAGLVGLSAISGGRSNKFRDTSISSVPDIDFSLVTSMNSAFFSCDSLISFQANSFASCASFSACWRLTTSMTKFNAKCLIGAPSTNFFNAWNGSALDQESVDDILVRIESNGLSNGVLDIDGGTNSAPSATGLAAKSALESRGWTVTTN